MLVISSCLLVFTGMVFVLLLVRRSLRLRRERRERRERLEARAVVAAWNAGYRIAAASCTNAFATVLLEEAVAQMKGAKAASVARSRAIVSVLDDHVFESLLTNARPEERLHRVRLLAHFRGRRVVRTLGATFATDADPFVRAAAAKGMAEHGRLPRVDVLIEHLSCAYNPSRIHFTIFRLFPPKRRRELRALLPPNRPLGLRLLAADSLGHAADGDAADLLAGLIDDRALDVRAVAIRGLARLEATRYAWQIAHRLADQAWEVRAQAAVCLGRFGFAQAAPLLRLLLRDGMWWVRFRAAEALLRLGADGRTVLAEIADTADDTGRMARSLLAQEAIAA